MKNKALAVLLAVMMTAGGLFVIANASESSDGATTTVTMGSHPSVVTLAPGDTLKVYVGTKSAELVMAAAYNISWMDPTSKTDGGGKYFQGVAQVGEYTFDAKAAGSFTIKVGVTVTYVMEGYPNETRFYPHNYPDLYQPPAQTNYTMKWYTAQTGGTFVGNAGHTVYIESSTTLYGRWVQSKVILPAASADVYVHYRDYAEYTIAPVPSDSTITAKWTSPSVTHPITVTGNVIRIDNVELDSGNYAMTVTAAKSGMTSTTMTLNIHVYPHEVKNLEPYGLGAWSYVVPTYNLLDRMELISAKRTTDGQTYAVTNGSITLDSATRMISHTFTAAGVYEFSLRLVSPAGDHCTTVVRIAVTNEVISAAPDCSGINVVPRTQRSFDFLLQNAVNFASITWDYGDGTTEMNTNTSRHHQYASPGIYTVVAVLSNTAGDTKTVTVVVDAMSVVMPTTAYRNDPFVAVVQVTATSSSNVTVQCPSWMTWSYLTSGTKNYVRISGTFSDVNTVGDSTSIVVTSNGTQAAKWTVTFKAATTDVLKADFEYVLDGKDIKIKYTGTKDGGTQIYVQWITGQGYTKYVASADGWMHHTYTASGPVTLTVSAIRDGIENTSSRTIPLPSSGSSGDPSGDDGSGDSEGTDPLLILGLILIILTFVAAAVGQFKPAIALGIAAILSFLGVIL